MIFETNSQIKLVPRFYYTFSYTYRIESSPLDNSFVSNRQLLNCSFVKFLRKTVCEKKNLFYVLLSIVSLQPTWLILEIRLIIFDRFPQMVSNGKKASKLRRETLTLLDASARESHPFTCSSSVTSATFPLCVSNLVNAECVITLARLTAGLKRTLRNQKTSPPFYRREKNEWIEIVFPFFLFLLLPFFFRNHRPTTLQPRILFIIIPSYFSTERMNRIRNYVNAKTFAILIRGSG